MELWLEYFVKSVLIPLLGVAAMFAWLALAGKHSSSRSSRLLECMRNRLQDARIFVDESSGCPTIAGTLGERRVSIRIEPEEGGDSVAVEVSLNTVPGTWPVVTVQNGVITSRAHPAFGNALMSCTPLVERRKEHESESFNPDQLLLTHYGAVRARDFGINDLLRRGAKLQLEEAVARALPAALEFADAIDAIAATAFPDLPWAIPQLSVAALADRTA